MSERSIKNFIPNLITLTGLCFGLSSIRFAVLEDFKAAVVCILIAAICDVLDGLFSRLLKTQSDLGAELDSLADFLSFGVAPGILVYFGILEELAIWGYLAVTAFIVFACLRLAIFNLNLPPTEDAQKQGYFLGVPHEFSSFGSERNRNRGYRCGCGGVRLNPDWSAGPALWCRPGFFMSNRN